jgi:hypothetical protein
MAIILTVGNQINTGGEGNSQAAGFSLDALLKLEEVSSSSNYLHEIYILSSRFSSRHIYFTLSILTFFFNRCMHYFF